jgi:hypothetical protein
MDFEEILKELRDSLLRLISEEYDDFREAAEKDVEAFLNESRDKLERWTKLLASGELTLEDYTWLLKSQKDLFVMRTLYNAGITQMRIEVFKNKVINTIIDVVSKLVL